MSTLQKVDWNLDIDCADQPLALVLSQSSDHPFFDSMLLRESLFIKCLIQSSGRTWTSKSICLSRSSNLKSLVPKDKPLRSRWFSRVHLWGMYLTELIFCWKSWPLRIRKSFTTRTSNCWEKLSGFQKCACEDFTSLNWLWYLVENSDTLRIGSSVWFTTRASDYREKKLRGS